MNVNAALRLLQAGALCFLLLSTNAAVIEVTAGGEVSEPTYRFSDASGNALATLVGNSTALSASADVVTGNGNSVDELATAMTSLQATIAQLGDFVVSGVPPTSSELTIASCSSPDVYYAAGTCDRAYDGNSATLWNTNTGTSAEKSMTITLSAAKTITRFEIDQDGKSHPTHAAQRAIIYYYDGDDGAGNLLWKGHHDFILYAVASPFVENTDFWIFPRVAGVKSIKILLVGNHPRADEHGQTGAQYRNWYRGIHEMKVYGY